MEEAPPSVLALVKGKCLHPDRSFFLDISKNSVALSGRKKNNSPVSELRAPLNVGQPPSNNLERV